MATHSSTLCLENSMDGGAWWATVHGVTKSRTQLSDFTYHETKRRDRTGGNDSFGENKQRMQKQCEQSIS